MIVDRTILAIAVLFGVHALVYAFVGLLPDAAVSALGLMGGNESAVARYWSTREAPEYLDHLLGMLRGDLGLTLDRVPVSSEIWRGLLSSGPIIFISLMATVILGRVVLTLSRTSLKPWIAWLDAGAFIPPFVIPLVFSAALYASPQADNPAAAIACLLLSLLIPSAALTGAFLARYQIEEFAAPYVTSLGINGLPETEVRRLVSASSLSRLLRNADRVAVLNFVCLMLAEPILGQAGLGTLASRAIRTADPNLILGVTVFIALVVTVSGILASWADRIYFGRLMRSA